MGSRQVTFEEIEANLQRLGGGNHADNLRSVEGFAHYYEKKLTKGEFFDLVFLQNEEVSRISPPGGDRRLEAVAGRAIRAADDGDTVLSSNWDLARLHYRPVDSGLGLDSAELGGLLIRDSRGSELEQGDWYLQDGSHRALAYAIAILRDGVTYQRQRAFLATELEFAE